MSLTRTVPRIAVTLGGLALCACSGIINAPATEDFMRMPLEVRMGAADMAIEPVEQGVGRDEVAEAVQGLVSEASLCFAWPGLWLQGEDRRNVYTVRFDLMARDWGEEAASASRARMQEFVDLGFLEGRVRDDLGPGVIEYTQTPSGAEYLRGSPYGGGSTRPEFCAPSQRRLVDITAMEWGRFPCGTLSVRFTHVADSWPDWARTEQSRARVDEYWAPAGVEMSGTVSLSRQWYRRAPAGSQNGALRSVCYDENRQEIAGGDLDLHAGRH